MRKFARAFYKSQAWKHTREMIMQRDHRLCVDCMLHGYITPAEEVHHIIELTPENISDMSIALGEENLVSLCRECHKKRHGSAKHRVDEFGSLIDLKSVL